MSTLNTQSDRRRSAVVASVAVPDLRNATFDVPDFPGTNACPAGKRTFASGRVPLPETDSSPVTLALNGKPVLGDVDSDGPAEVLTAIACHEYTPNAGASPQARR